MRVLIVHYRNINVLTSLHGRADHGLSFTASQEEIIILELLFLYFIFCVFQNVCRYYWQKSIPKTFKIIDL